MSHAKKIGFLIIDFNNDFLGEDDGTPYSEVTSASKKETASLAVPGGKRAADRTTHVIRTYARPDDSIDVSEDAHSENHSATPNPWHNEVGQHPKPFTFMPAMDASHHWRFGDDSAMHHKARNYLVALEATGRWHMIWPVHCVKGTWGQKTYAPLMAAITDWDRAHGPRVVVTKKGGALIPEHFGIFEAEVPDPDDPSTQTNWPLLNSLYALDQIIVAGLVLEICVKRSIEQFLKYKGNEAAKKLVILTDCTAAIDQKAGEAFLAKLRELGATVTTSTEYFAHAA